MLMLFNYDFIIIIIVDELLSQKILRKKDFDSRREYSTLLSDEQSFTILTLPGSYPITR